MNRPHHFSAGPAVLPLEVLKKAQAEFLTFADTGLSVLEISHRFAAFDQVIEQAETRLRDLLAIPSDYHVLFLQGGASLQFAMLAMNFLHRHAAYVDGGAWSKKALQEAQKLQQVYPGLQVDTLWSGKDEGYSFLPDEQLWQQLQTSIDPNLDYIHTISNETIQGIALQADPESSVPLFCDMSSDILSRPVHVGAYDLIYAGAQKNMGPAGVTVVILKDRLLSKIRDNVPTMLDYRTHVEKKSLYNTPPVFSIYMLNLVMEWLQEQGGLSAMYTRNQKQAQAIYEVLDAHPDFYRGHARPGSRSLMNITFTLPETELEQRFLAEAGQHQLMSLKGHRSVGGIRASIYNACPDASVEALVDFMRTFHRQNA